MGYTFAASGQLNSPVQHRPPLDVLGLLVIGPSASTPKHQTPRRDLHAWCPGSHFVVTDN